MTRKIMDEILSRWFRDKQFREQLHNNPQKALANYDLSQKQKAKLFKLKERQGWASRKRRFPACQFPITPSV